MNMFLKLIYTKISFKNIEIFWQVGTSPIFFQVVWQKPRAVNKFTWGCCRTTTNRCPAPVLSLSLLSWVLPKVQRKKKTTGNSSAAAVAPACTVWTYARSAAQRSAASTAVIVKIVDCKTFCFILPLLSEIMSDSSAIWKVRKCWFYCILKRSVLEGICDAIWNQCVLQH